MPPADHLGQIVNIGLDSNVSLPVSFEKTDFPSSKLRADSWVMCPVRISTEPSITDERDAFARLLPVTFMLAHIWDDFPGLVP